MSNPELPVRLFEPEDMKIPDGAHVRELRTADGVTLRFARWDAKGPDNRGTICLLPGIPETIEQYYETAENCLDRGYAFAIFDWRSQGGSERPVANVGKVHIRSFDDYARDLDAFVQCVQAECSSPYYGIGFSTGALNLLIALANKPRFFERATAIAPPLIADFKGIPRWVMHGVAGTLVGVGLGRLPLEKYDPVMHAAHPHLGDISDDPVRSERYWKSYFLDPSLFSDQRTLSWALAYTRVVTRFDNPDFGNANETPLLVLRGTSDHRAPAHLLEPLVGRIPDASYLEIPDARHCIFHESDAIRARLWNELDTFLA